MKIISIHVNNFGKLHNVDLSFNEGINATCEENGYGKSTLSSFIKAMLYGLDGDRVRDELLNERKRFAPWQGGAFGGSMTFEAGGKTYVATRVFHDKAADDEYELRDAYTNLVSTDYSEKLGEELFNINSESFMKTVYIRQNEAKSAGVTGDINAKLGNISDGIDLNKFADADALLKDTLLSLSPTRKTGSISKLKSRVSEVKASLLATNSIEASLKTLDERIDNANKEIENCNLEISKLNDTRARVAKLERKRSDRKKYEELVIEVNNKQDSLSMLKSEVGDRLPDKTLMAEWKRALDSINENKAVLNANSLSPYEKEIFSDLVIKFSNKMPEESEINELINDSARLNNLKQNAGRMLLTHEEQERLERLSMFYKPDEDIVGAVSDVNAKWSSRTKILADYSNTMMDIDELEKNRPNFKIYKIEAVAFMCAAVFLIILSVVGGIFVHPVLSVSALLGIALICAGLTARKRGREELIKYEDRKSNLKKNASLLDNQALEIENSIADFLQAHGRAFDEENVLNVLSNLLIEAADYKSLYNKKQLAAKDNSSTECIELTKKISSYLMGFNINVMDDSLQSALVDLKAKADHYKSLKTKADNFNKAYNISDSMTLELKASMKEYGIEPGLDITGKFEEVTNKLSLIEVAEHVYKDALKRKESFEEEVDVVALLTEESEEDNLSLEDIETKAAEIELVKAGFLTSLQTDNRQRDGLLEQYEARQELLDELEALEEEINTKTREYKRLGLTQEFLTKAKESLTARYMEPLLTGFNKYYRVLTCEEASDYRIDANTKVTIEAEGKQRDTQLLSSGYQDLTGVCMRLAMADAMYPDEKPVLILDDPFVNLDDTKLIGGKNLINEVSKEYQVLYFTCSRSRL